jgi:hypothetical protein
MRRLPAASQPSPSRRAASARLAPLPQRLPAFSLKCITYLAKSSSVAHAFDRAHAQDAGHRPRIFFAQRQPPGRTSSSWRSALSSQRSDLEPRPCSSMSSESSSWVSTSSCYVTHRRTLRSPIAAHMSMSSSLTPPTPCIVKSPATVISVFVCRWSQSPRRSL